jgi:UDP-3-O-[3-hydroxymyristoyl] glucosamine N-acyltransferase
MKLSEIIAEVGGELEGDGALEISGLASLAEAGKGDISFLANKRYTSDVASTKASAVIVNRDWEGDCPCALVRVDSADAAFAQVAELISPPAIDFGTGIHPTAVISEGVSVGDGVYIGPCCVLEPGVVVGDGCVLVANCYVGHDTVLGDNCQLMPQVSIRERVKIGRRVTIHNGAVIGSDGFGYTPDKEGVWHKVRQLGTVEICDDVEIGANVTIDRARFGVTKIGKGVKIDNLVQIAHNVVIEEHAVMASQVGISGSTRIGAHAQLGGQAGLAGHLKVGEWSVVGAQGGVTKDVQPKTFVSGYPAMDHRKASKMHAHMMRLPDLKKRVRELENELKKIREGMQ